MNIDSLTFLKKYPSDVERLKQVFIVGAVLGLPAARGLFPVAASGGSPLRSLRGFSPW